MYKIISSIVFLISLTNNFNSCITNDTNKGKLLYFAYGSNLLTNRIHIQNPSAIKRDIAILHDYKLDFYGYSKRWEGAPATIVPKSGKSVLGIVWELNSDDVESLDKQEGVPSGLYFPLNVTVEKFHNNGTVFRCRTYQITNIPAGMNEENDNPLSDPPDDRQPSYTYLKTIVKGALESNFPDSYVRYLKSFKHNGNTVSNFEKLLDLENLKW